MATEPAGPDSLQRLPYMTAIRQIVLRKRTFALARLEQGGFTGWILPVIRPWRLVPGSCVGRRIRAGFV